MNRKGISMLLIEVISFLIFSITIVIWFYGIELLIGGISDTIPVRNFNKFLEPVRSVCNGAQEATAFNLDLSTFGTTYLVTQIKIPSIFRQSPTDYGMIPLQMKKCVGETCVCLMDLKEYEGDWQMCTTAEWDLFSMATGMAPGCPFWYYAPPDMVEQMVSNAMAFMNFGGELAASAVGTIIDSLQGEGNYDRNYFSYPAPEFWGGCSNADVDEIGFSTFYSSTNDFQCSIIKNKKLGELFDNIQSSTPVESPNPIILIESNYVPDDEYKSHVLLAFNDFFSKKISEQIQLTLPSLFFEYYKDYYNSIDSLSDDLIITSFNDAKNNYKSKVKDTLVLIGYTDPETLSTQVVNNLESNINNLIDPLIIAPINKDIDSYQEITNDFGAKITFELTTPISQLKSALLNVYALNNEEASELRVSVNGFDYLIVDLTDFTQGYIELSIPVNQLNYGANSIIISTDSNAYLGLIPLFSGLTSYRNNNGNFVEFASNDYLANITFNRDFETDTFESSFSALIFNNYLSQVLVEQLEQKFQLTESDSISFAEKIKLSFKDNYYSFFTELKSKTVFNEECSNVLVLEDEFFTYDLLLKEKIEELATQYLNTEFSEATIETMLSSSFNFNNYDFDSLKTAVTNSADDDFFENQINIISERLAELSWDYIKAKLLESINDEITVDSMRTQLTTDYESLIKSSIIAKINKQLFINALTPDSINIINPESKIDLIPPKLFQSIPTYSINIINNLYYNQPKESATITLNELNSIINEKLISDSYAAIADGESTAWVGGDLKKIPCWLGPDGNYFEGFNKINDLLGYNRYTSIARVTPGLLFTHLNPGAVAGTLSGIYLYNKYATAGNYQILGEQVVKKTIIKKGMTVDEFKRLMGPDNIVELLSGAFVAVGEKSHLTLTGYSLGAVVSTMLKEELKTAFKEYVMGIIRGYLMAAVGSNIESAINLPTGTFFGHIFSGWSKDIIYSDGSIRTFDPNTITPVSCFTMSELGCNKEQVLYVEEDYSCYTEIFVRNLGDIKTWLKLILGSDECLMAYSRGTCNQDELSSDGVCYKDTLTACYKLTCEKITDKRKIFQYWVGAAADPASFGPPASSRISKLTVTNDKGKIVLKVPNSEGGGPSID